MPPLAYPRGVTSTPSRADGRTRRPRVDRRQAIIDAAIELAGEKPFDEVNAADIVRRAGVSHGLLFYYFRDKWAVTAEALGQLLEELREFQAPRESESTVDERLAGFARRHVQFVQEHQASYLALLRGGAMARAEVRAMIDEARREGVAALGLLLELEQPLSPMDDLALSGWVALLDVCTERVLTDPSLDADTVADWAAARLRDALARPAPGGR